MVTKYIRRSQLSPEVEKQKEDGVAHAMLYTDSLRNSVMTINHLHSEIPDLPTLAEQLNKKVNQISDGDLSNLESMLMVQACTLDAVFNNMMLKIGHTEFLSQTQAYSEIAFKAQNQCRKTLIALAEMKNPKRATFIKQQNLAVNQQVNNEPKLENSKNSKKLANELLSLEKKEDEILDTRRAPTTGTTNSKVETVEISRRKDPRR